jgi:hypothetical protein
LTRCTPTASSRTRGGVDVNKPGWLTTTNPLHVVTRSVPRPDSLTTTRDWLPREHRWALRRSYYLGWSPAEVHPMVVTSTWRYPVQGCRCTGHETG